MEWISVKDKLPKKGERVLVDCDQKKYNPSVTILVMPEHKRIKQKWYSGLWKGATHWMPLPESSKE